MYGQSRYVHQLKYPLLIPSTALVLRFVLKSQTVREILDERSAPVMAAGCRSGVVYKHCFVG